MMPSRAMARRRDCRVKGWRMQISRDRKQISVKDVQTGEVLCEGSKIVMESYLDGYFDGIEDNLGSRLPKAKHNEN